MGITHSWNGTVLTITSDSGSSSADLKGPQGDTGIRGPQGVAGKDAISTEELTAAVNGYMDEHLPEGETIVLDASLATSGFAADAKATGDAITVVNNYAESVNNKFDFLFNRKLITYSLGSINTTQSNLGGEIDSNTRIRSDYIPISDIPYMIVPEIGVKARVLKYGPDKTLYKVGSYETTPQNEGAIASRYFRIVVAYEDDRVITDIAELSNKVSVYEMSDVNSNYRGNIIRNGLTTFYSCQKDGYYTYSYHDIANIEDAPAQLKSGGILEVRPNAASGDTFQTIICANGDTFFRWGANEFKKTNIEVENNTTTEFSVVPENIGVLNAIRNAKQCSEIKYTPMVTLPTQRYTNGFPANKELKGLPYSSTRYEQLYVPNNVSLYTFMSALKNPNAYVYTIELDNEEDYPNALTNARTYYGIVCSMLVEYALNIECGYTTSMWANIPNMEKVAEDNNPYKLKLGDILWRSGHVMMITDIKMNQNGRLHGFEITEATNGYTGRVISYYYTLEEFYENIINSTKYKYYFYRYADIDKVEHTPNPIIPVEDEVINETVRYNTNLMGRLGDKFNVIKDTLVEIDVLNKADYTHYKVFNVDTNTAIFSSTIPSDGYITFQASVIAGKYGICLTDGNNDSEAITFIVVECSLGGPPNLQSNKYILSYSCSDNATPVYVGWFGTNTETDSEGNITIKRALMRSLTQHTEGSATAYSPDVSTVKTIEYARVALKTEYGTIMSQVRSFS